MLKLFCTDIREADEHLAKRRGRSPQRGSAFGVSLLEYAVRQVWGIPMPKIVPPMGGKPSFEGEPEKFFSISHTKTHVLVALSDAPVGADVETHREISPGSAAALMDEIEQEQFDFFDLWCLRESLYKLNGAGNLREVLHFRREGDAIVYPVPGVTGQILSGIDGCSAAVCQEREFLLPELQWVDVRELCEDSGRKQEFST